MKPCRCGATDTTATDHAVNIDGDLHVHAERVACFVITRPQGERYEIAAQRPR